MSASSEWRTMQCADGSQAEVLDIVSDAEDRELALVEIQAEARQNSCHEPQGKTLKPRAAGGFTAITGLKVVRARQ